MKAPLDYETNTTHVFLVLASSDNFFQSSLVTVTVIVTDVNDEAPVFTMAQYTGSIDENKQGVSILTVQADDLDTPEVQYELLEGTLHISQLA